VAEHKEEYVLRNLKCRISSMVAWCERWSITINEDKIQAIYFSH
jgi:hypothetical protein